MTASLCDVVAEWSKASRLGRDPFAGVGSNPIHISDAVLSKGSAPHGPDMRAPPLSPSLGISVTISAHACSVCG